MAFTFTTAAWTVRSLLIGAVLYSVAASNPSARAQSTPACSECEASQSEHRLMGTHYDLQSFRVSLIVNNKGPDLLPVSLTAYSLDGEPLELGALAMEGNSAEMLDLNEILESHPPRFRQGSLELGYRYEGCPLVVSAGIVMQDEAAGVGSDELFARPPDFRSSRLEAVWWAPSVRARMQLALSNRSQETISAQIGVQSLGAIAERKSMQVTLRPRETRTLNVPKALLIEGLGSAQWGSGSISIEHTGAPGQLTARGAVEDRAVRYSGVIEFSDPESGVSSRLHGAGLRVGSFKDQPLIPVVVLRNAADEPSQVTIRLPWSDDQGNTETAHVQTLILAAGEVREMNGQFLSALATLPDELVDSAGLEIEYSTAPGTVLAAAQAVAADGSRVFRLPLIDPDTKGSAGNYPWKLDQETATVVYLKNVTDRIQKYTAQVDFEDGSYVLGLNELQPGQTFRLDLAELRESQQPDQHGTVLPADASSGQIHWSVIGTDNHSMIGRAEYVHEKTGLATTFACSSCCPDSYYNSWVSPPSAQFPFDASFQYSAFQQNQNCYGSPLGPFGVSGSWSSDNTSVVIMSTFVEGEAEPVNTGYAIVVVVIQVVRWFFQSPSQGCVSHIITAGGSGGATVWDFAVIPEHDAIWPVQTPGNSQTSIRVQMTPPLNGQNVSLSLKEVPNSGGHTAHTGQRPLGTFFQNSGSTNSSGFFETLYASPTPSGLVQIDATVHSVTRSAFVEVRVPGLNNLSDGSNYFLKRTDPKHGNGDYHYGTQGLHQAIVNAADHFWNNWGSSQSPQMGMVPNDQSLVWGGLFDISGNWSTAPFGHTTHREGNIVDITFRVWTGGSNIDKVDPNFCELSSQSLCETAMQRLGQALDAAFGGCPVHSAGTSNAHWHCTE